VTVITFDTHSAVKRLTQKGVPEGQAEELVKILSEINELDISKLALKDQVTLLGKEIKNLIYNIATKADLEQVSNELKAEIHRVEENLKL